MTSLHTGMFRRYMRKAYAELRPYVPGEDLDAINVSVSAEDTPELGGMVARNPKNHADQWYVAKQFFADNYVTDPVTDEDVAK